MSEEHDALLHYYIQELTYLRQMGVAFAKRYPKIAPRLELTEEECPDPHVERLIEAVAFLTGRIQYNIDKEFPIFTTALLDILYPHYLQPIPELTIAQFDIDPTQGQFTTGHLIPKNSGLSTQNAQGVTCRFRTCYPVMLWPLTISFAGFEPPEYYDFLDASTEVAQVLRLRFSCQGSTSLAELQLERLRLYIHESWLEAGPLYELIFSHLLRIAVLSPEQKNPVILPAETLLPVGFDEEVLPYPPYAHPSYRLLQEYFAFSDKFLFFDLTQLQRLQADENQKEFDVLLLLDSRPDKVLNIDRESFRLGCTPIINLFSKPCEPIRLTHQHSEYRLVPDIREEFATEIHSVTQVLMSTENQDETVALQPFFSFRHGMQGERYRAFWYARRVPTKRVDLTGTDMLLSFFDLNFSPVTSDKQTIFTQALCTNRGYADQIPAGTRLEIEASAPLSRVYCLKRPTIQLNPPLEGATVWRIISHLSLNHLSLTEGNNSLPALREILKIYNLWSRNESIERQVDGIRTMNTQQIVRRLGPDAWRGFIRGLEITLELDKRLYVGGSALLFANVLERFFALYISTNSFIQLVLKEHNREGIWKRWPPRSGQKTLL